MYIAFDTDHGNYGLTTAGTHEDPGFYADWHFAAHLENAGICASDWEGAPLNCPTLWQTAHAESWQRAGRRRDHDALRVEKKILA